MLAAVCKLHYWKIPHMSLFYSLVVILSFLALCELRLLWSFVGVRRGNYGWTAFLNLYARLWRIAAGLLSMAVIFNSVRPRKRSHTTLLKRKTNKQEVIRWSSQSERFIFARVTVDLESIVRTLGMRWEYSLDTMAEHHRAHPGAFKCNKSTGVFLGGGRKPESPVETHARTREVTPLPAAPSK